MHKLLHFRSTVVVVHAAKGFGSTKRATKVFMSNSSRLARTHVLSTAVINAATVSYCYRKTYLRAAKRPSA